MPGESLVPGYKLVETFGPDSEYETRPPVDSEGNEGEEEEVEEEVEYVTLEISGIADVDPNLLTSYRLIGVDTPTPFLQLSSSGTIFKGRHHKLLGTELLFSHAQGDADPSARHITLLGTTEQRIVFAPVEIRNPASSSSASRSTSKAKTSGKESASNPKKGKKKTNIGTGGIEEVAGSLNVGVSKSPAVADRDPAAESGPSTRNKAAGKKKDTMTQDDDEMYATEEEYGAGEGGGDGTLEVNVGGGEDAGEGGEDTNAGLLSRKKRKPSRNDANKGKGAGSRSTQGPTTISTPMPATVSEPNTVEVTPLTGSDIPMAIDPALEALNVPESQSSPQASGSGTAI